MTPQGSFCWTVFQFISAGDDFGARAKDYEFNLIHMYLKIDKIKIQLFHFIVKTYYMNSRNMGSTWNGQNWSLEGRPKATSTISIAGVALPTDVTVPRAVLNLNKSPHPKQRIPYIDNIFCNYLFIIFLFFTYVKILCTWHKQRSPEEPKNDDGDKTYKNAYFMECHRS